MRTKVHDAVAVLRLDETWRTREITMLGGEAQHSFASFARHAEDVDFLVVHREDAERVVVVPWEFWLRLLATVGVANGYPVHEKTDG